MRIAIAGGRGKADYLIRLLLSRHHQVVALHDDPDYCAYLSRQHHIPVICGDPCKRYVLDDAEIDGFDLLVALRPSDADNLVICQSAQRLYHVKRTLAVVASPKSVELFQKLGVTTALSAAYLASQYIEQAAAVEGMVDTLPLENGRLSLTELLITAASPAAGKKVARLPLPQDAVICCILRGADMLVARGEFQVLANDKLLVLSPAALRESVVAALRGGNGVV